MRILCTSYPHHRRLYLPWGSHVPSSDSGRGQRLLLSAGAGIRRRVRVASQPRYRVDALDIEGSTCQRSHLTVISTSPQRVAVSLSGKKSEKATDALGV